MGGWFWPFVGALLGVAACSGSAMQEQDSTSRGDAGGATGPDAGPGAALEAGTFLADSGISSIGTPGDLDDGGLTGDTGAEVGMPPRIDGGTSWTNAVPTGMPQVLNNGGPTLTSPVFQAVTFANYDLTTYVDDFVSRVGTTSYWQHAVGEYGVGIARAATPVHLSEGAAQNIDDTEIQTWLANELATNADLMPVASGAVYVLFYPFASTITFQGEESCFTMGAYHNSTVVGGVNVVYAVIPECATETTTEQDRTTSAASHEMIEAATDPLPLSATPAYVGTDPGHLYYPMVLGGGEVGDMCSQWPASFFVPDDLPYTVQRTWSNAAAAAGRDPCQPALDGETFFNAVPVLTDTVHVGPGLGVSTMGASIAPGTSKVIDVHLYSEADVGPWTVSAISIPVGGSNLTFSWDTTTGNNGDVLHLTITANYVESSYGGEPFLIESTLDGATSYWVGFVGQ
jgi:hypothetical protein